MTLQGTAPPAATISAATCPTAAPNAAGGGTSWRGGRGLVAVFAGILLGLVAVIVDCVRIDLPLGPFTIFAAVFVGGFVGIVSSPVVFWALWQKDLRIALPIVYGTAGLIAVLVTITSFSPVAAPVVFLNVVINCAVLKIALPTTFHDVARYCPRPSGMARR